MADGWRDEAERARLVEQLIESERRCRLLERALREYGEQEGDRSLGSYVVALHARIAGLEQNIQRLTAKRGKGEAA